MIFFFKPKTIVVDAFTPHEMVAENYPLTPSQKLMPKWWKELPTDCPPERHWPKILIGTMKRCQGFIDQHVNSWTMPLWTDVTVEMMGSPNGIEARYATADKITSLVVHENIQWRGFADPRQYHHYKIMAPWWIKSKSDILWDFVPATWSHGEWLNTLTVLPGQIDFKYQHVVHVNTFWKLGPNNRTSELLTAGTPLVQLSPRTENKVEIKTHCVDLTEFNKMMHLPKFSGLYKENKQRKCPFH
jgi:hypothetical protein